MKKFALSMVLSIAAVLGSAASAVADTGWPS